MSFLTESQLLESYRSLAGVVYKSQYLMSSKETASASIFLSHSHKDVTLVQGLLNLLTQSKLSIFVDWQDSEMPRITSRETAAAIKRRISDLDYFLILATQNAMESRWVPWEIGVADSRKPIDKIAIIPVADTAGRFYGNEYLQLYQNISIGTNTTTNAPELGVFPIQTISVALFKESKSTASQGSTGVTLRSWLSSS